LKFTLKEDKAKNEVKEAINYKIKALTKRNKGIEGETEGQSNLGKELNRYREVLKRRFYSNEELIEDLKLMRYIAGS
jgi:hypothetical protein